MEPRYFPEPNKKIPLVAKQSDRHHVMMAVLFLCGVVALLFFLYSFLRWLPGQPLSFFASTGAPVGPIRYTRAGVAADGTVGAANQWLSGPEIDVRNIIVPKVSAKAYIIGDIKSGQVLAEKNSEAIYPIASITKLMTAIISDEKIDPKKKITITADILRANGKSGHLVEGEKIFASDILYPLLMESSNDAAKAISTTFGEGKFIGAMNTRAQSLGMTHTVFADSAGISARNVSTAQDLFRLAQYVQAEKPFVFEISKLPGKEFATRGNYHDLRNANLFIKDERFVGGKVGYTSAAHETMVALFDLPVTVALDPVDAVTPSALVSSAKAAAISATPNPTRTDTHTIAIIILGSNTRQKDIGTLFKWFEDAVK